MLQISKDGYSLNLTGSLISRIMCIPLHRKSLIEGKKRALFWGDSIVTKRQDRSWKVIQMGLDFSIHPFANLLPRAQARLEDGGDHFGALVPV